MNRKRRKKEAARRKSHGDIIPFPTRSMCAFGPGVEGFDAGEIELVLRLLQQLLLNDGGSSADTPADRAQALAFDAMNASASHDAVILAMEALEIDDGCLDAHMILAENLSSNAEEFILRTRRALVAAEHGLGNAVFEENRGCFWSDRKTRQYLRVREALAHALRSSGRIEEEMREYEEMLELNPDDNQGVRFSLLGRYLQCDDLTGARRLLDRYGTEGDALFDWARVLERWLSSDEEGAATVLEHARGDNPFVELYLTGKKTPPEKRRDSYFLGSREEAAVCMDEIGPAWTAHPDAVDWLKRAG